MGRENLLQLSLYSDGGCWGNPGVGGWGVLLKLDGQTLVELKGGDAYTTNNKMELSGVIQGLIYVLNSAQKNSWVIKKLDIFTDSRYVVDGCKTWRHGWKKKNWMMKPTQEVKNVNYWQQLDSLLESLPFPWDIHWVKGHSGHEENERCDQLATQAIMELLDEQRKRK